MRQRASAMLPLALPMIAIIALFAAYPLAISLGLATQRTFGTRVATDVGPQNFLDALADPLLRKAAWNTALFTIFSVLVQVPIALAVALLLERPRLWARGLIRLALLLPHMVGLAYAGVFGAVAFEKRTGMVNRALHATFNTDLDLAWLENAPITTMVIISAWLYIGLNALILRAAMGDVDPARLGAATLDGASPLSRLRHVTIPAIRPVLGLVVLLSVVGSVQAFELPYVLLQGGGVENRGLTVVTYLYQQGFEIGDLGYASAIGWLLSLVMLALIATTALLSRRSDA